MIKYNELRISPEGKYLIIDIEVLDSPYYKNITLDSISIDTQDTYIENGPSEKVIYTKKISDSIKKIRLELTSKDLKVDLNKTMLFIYVRTKGIPAPETPCGLDNSLSLRSVINLYPIYQLSLCYTKEINRYCEIPKGFIDMILRIRAIELCIKTGNYTLAIKYWNKYNSKDFKLINYKCGCNG